MLVFRIRFLVVGVFPSYIHKEEQLLKVSNNWNSSEAETKSDEWRVEMRFEVTDRGKNGKKHKGRV